MGSIPGLQREKKSNKKEKRESSGQRLSKDGSRVELHLDLTYRFSKLPSPVLKKPEEPL